MCFYIINSRVNYDWDGGHSSKTSQKGFEASLKLHREIKYVSTTL